MDKFFTLDEAESLIPAVKERLQQAIESKKNAENIEQELQAISARINLLGGSAVNPVAVSERKRARDWAIQKLKESLQEIEKSGCLVKDLDIGLIDFPARLKNKEVYLCWKLGEPRIEYWHGVDEGFAGRKRITDEFGDRAEPSKPN